VSAAQSFAAPARVPSPSTLSTRRIWSIGGGKGGIGKSLLAASLGAQLARMGKRVVLVDADLGGANLHTCLGVAGPPLTLGDFIRRRVEKIEDVAVETGRPGLRLISGASDFLSAANINYAQKVRVLNRIKALDVDVVLMDLGAGTAYNIIDFFLASDVSLLVVVPEPTSIENGYRFIKSALYRRLRRAAEGDEVRRIVDSAMDAKDPSGIRNPLDLLAAVEREDPAAAESLRRELRGYQPHFVVNQVRSEADAAIGQQLVTACARHLGIRSTNAGFVRYDDAVWRCVRQRRLFVDDPEGARPSEDVQKIAAGLLRGENLTLPWS
jgi:flagellar biosynthesis protein FlhG